MVFLGVISSATEIVCLSPCGKGAANRSVIGDILVAKYCIADSTFRFKGEMRRFN